MSADFLSIENVKKQIDNEVVLRKINLSFKKGQIHAVVGDHGSGKTILCNILAGREKFTKGKIKYDDKVFFPNNYRGLKKLPIQVVPQTLNLLNNFTVANNLFIPDLIRNWFPSGKKELIKKAKAYFEEYSIDIDPTTMVDNLSISESQLIVILRAFIRDPEIILLDSPFDLLTAKHTEHVKQLLIREKEKGKTIIYFTNRIEYLERFADTISILKKGTLIWNSSITDIDRMNILKMCYTEISLNDDRLTSDQEIYELFKFNEAILHNLPISIIVADQMYNIRLLNKMGKQFFNIEDSASETYNLKKIINENNPEVWDEIEKLFDSESIHEIYNLKLLYNNETFNLYIKCFPVSDSLSVIGHMLLIQDVSKQETLREQVILSEKLASVGLLAAGVAHEINNPLEIVYNIISYLKYNTKDADQLDLLEDLEEEVTLIKQIVSNLISFSDTSKVKAEVFDVNELIGKLINLIKYNAKYRKVSINQSLRDEISISADKTEIRQVLLNLFKNSLEAMPDGGIINVETSIIEEKDRKWCLIRSSDTGYGIDESILKNIFLPFYSTKNKQGQNMGLGLSVSYGIIQKYRGTMDVKNLKTGCEFVIKLPLAGQK